MVTRKPLPSRVVPPQEWQTPDDRPYAASSASNEGTINSRRSKSPRASPSFYEMDDAWADETPEMQKVLGIPESSRSVVERRQSAGNTSVQQENLPSSLRIRRPVSNQNTAEENQRFQNSRLQPAQSPTADAGDKHQYSEERGNETNPFSGIYRGTNTWQSIGSGDESLTNNIWWEKEASPVALSKPLPPPPPAEKRTANGSLLKDESPVTMTANLSITDRPVSEFSTSFRPSDGNSNERYHALNRQPLRSSSQFSPPVSPHEYQPHNVLVPTPPTSPPPTTPSARPALRPTQSSVTSAQSSFTHRTTGSIGWDPGLDISALDADTSRNHGLPGVGEGFESQSVPRTWEEQQAWERKERQMRAEQVVAASERAERAERERKAEEEWHEGEAKLFGDETIARVDTAQTDVYDQLPYHEGSNTSHRLHENNLDPGPVPLQRKVPVPDTPSRIAEESQEPPAKKVLPPPPDQAAYNGDVEIQQSTTKRQRSETYQIKVVCWYDVSSASNPRKSPILIQNANGPCPLLALVNALVLSTPADTATALVETLRVREQVSLGLLLDAVFDELMSGRRGGAAQELPDVGDLYSFLITLHTGMNVNPRFVALPPPGPDLMVAPPPSPPAIVSDNHKPGTFEETREMRLYSTFNIPLIHGWLAPRNHMAYRALERSARTYEDAQNLLFREEELEEKLKREGLNPDEQILLGDIADISYFLSSSATQLTQFGLYVITEAMHPGSIAILFRNDHFSTLYKHPRSEQLLTLVTDMGYAGHDEVVWESLVDVSGEGAEFLAGDFRPVGNVTSDAQGRETGTSADDEGWTTVHAGSNTSRNSKLSTAAAAAPGRRPSATHLEPNTTTLPSSSPATEQEDHDLALALQLQEEEEDRLRQQTAARRREDELSRAFLSSEEPPTSTSTPRGRGRGRGGTRAQGQDVRPLVPPRGTPRPGTTRAANEDGPPPSYEQAARGPAYHPPPNHPSHPHALPGGARPGHVQAQGRQMSAYSQTAALHGGGEVVGAQHRPGQRRSTGARASRIEVGVMGPGAGGSGMARRRSAGGVASTALEVDAGRKDKDCVVM